MNDAELKANKQATDYSLGDLNKDPTLPYDDSTFDFVTNVVSVDYLIRPQEVQPQTPANAAPHRAAHDPPPRPTS